ncbi:hypothetical protein LIER_27212 [Lithospermum erythrorhizon]|uniref:VQ domain-containing protein n=1 Tax=Lithospermum erythrorhizon TaxID=34254 RepID=A0AAV3RH44_LITER
MKMYIAPFPRIAPKIHYVEPKDFKDVVHRLTTTAEYQLSHPLDEVAPPPASDISVGSPHKASLIILDSDDDDERQATGSFDELLNLGTIEHEITENSSDYFGALSPHAFQNPPYSSQSWIPSPLWSPGTISSLEQAMLF